MFGWFKGAKPPNNKTSSKSFFQNPFAAYSQPLVQQPLVQQPLVQQPLVQQPLVQQPLLQPSIAAAPQPPPNIRKRSFFQNPFAAYTQQPVSIPVPVPVPVAAAPQLNANNNPNNANNYIPKHPYNKLLDEYKDLESHRNYLEIRQHREKSRGVNTTKTDEELIMQNDKIAKFLRNIPPDSINYKAAEDDYGGNRGINKGDSFLIIAAQEFSHIGVRILCNKGANPNNFGRRSGTSLLKVAMQTREDMLKMWGYDPIEFIAAVKQCTGSKGGHRYVKATKKARRKRRHVSRRR